MPLTIIKGPPNTGRTELVRQGYLDLLHEQPVLVVPGVDDIFGWERRLAGDAGALLGGQIVHFKDLYGLILAAAGEERPRVAGELRRLHLVREAVREAWKVIASRLSEQPGLAEALLRLIDDFRAENVDPDTLEARIEDGKLHHLKRLTAVYRGYLEALARHGLTDGPAEAGRAVAQAGLVWKSRPVMIAGFDELTPQQLELVRRLAFDAGAEVTVAVTHEPDNPALALTDELVASLVNLHPDQEPRMKPTSRGDVERPHDPLLLELERRFMRHHLEGEAPLARSEALTVIRSAGPRNEAEAVGLEIARLISSGVPPEEIAVAVEAPARNGPVIRETLERFEIPVTLEAETAAARTATGQALTHLLTAAGPADSVTSLLAYMRGPAGPEPGQADHLERRIRLERIESAREAVGLIAKEHSPPHWDELTACDRRHRPPAELLEKLATGIALAALSRDPRPLPSPASVTETRMAAAIGRACHEVAGFHRDGGLAPVIEALESTAVKVWAPPESGTVLIASPYSLRAKRFSCLFYASLQESGLFDSDRAGPFLSVRDRKGLGLTPYRDPEIQQRYLFYSTLTVPTRGLWLSCRTADENGKPEHPSPLIETVESLFAADEEGHPDVRTLERGTSRIIFPPADAPTVNELARSLAAAGSTGGDDPAGNGLAPDTAACLDARLAGASARERRTRRLRSLTLPEVLAELGSDPVFSATAIEAYATCPYRWFIERVLRPQRFGPDPRPLSMGSLVHNVLERLYREHPGAVPRPGTLAEWRDRVPDLIAEEARSRRIGLGGDGVSERALRDRAAALIDLHLGREAARGEPQHLPAMLELGFGIGNSRYGPIPVRPPQAAAAGDAPLGGTAGAGWSLAGKIDRIDVGGVSADGGGRGAVVIDYKTGSVKDLTWKKAEKDRRFQVPLYLYAIGHLHSVDPEFERLDPLAGIYVPLKANESQSRGACSERISGEMLDRAVAGNDILPDEEFRQFIDDGVTLADRAVREIMAGVLDHDPALCPNHFEHPAVPDRPAGQDSEGEG